MTSLQVVPIDQRLDLLGVVSHAKPVVLMFLFLLIVIIAASVLVWIGQLSQAKRSSNIGDNALSAVLVAAPLLGLTAAVYDLLDMSIGIANVRPAPDLTILAPGFAEASLCILLGLLAASLAAAFRTHLRLFANRQTAA